MVKAIDPVLRVGLSAMNRPDVMRLGIIVPSSNFNEVKEIAVLNDLLPPSVV